MSICNYCTLQNMRTRAFANNQLVVTRPVERDWGMGGVDVHVLKQGEEPSHENSKAWFMELPDHCCC